MRRSRTSVSRDAPTALLPAGNLRHSARKGGGGVAGIRRLILDHTLTNKTNMHVRFNNFSESSLDILVIFYFDIQGYGV